MVKSYFIELAAYNQWANNIVCGWLEQISEEQWTKQIVSSFPSIRETVLHVAGAEDIWLRRLKKEDSSIGLASVFKGTKDELISLWKQSSEGLKKFITGFDESRLNEKLDYKRLNGMAYSTPYYQVMGHVINHATYHRGQLVTMLRQAGFTDVTSTDLGEFYRA
jgi:uncharacterized damage-inducible protein DinB